MRGKCARRRKAGEGNHRGRLEQQQEEQQQLGLQEEEDGKGENESEGVEKGAPKGGPSFWDSVCLLLRQFDGMVDGYQVGEPAVGMGL